MKPFQFAYSAYSLQLASDQALPGLVPVGPSLAEALDLCIQLGTESLGAENDPAGEILWYTTDILDAGGNPALKIWKGKTRGDFYIRYSHGLTFCVDSTVTHVCVHRVRSTTEEDITDFLLGPVLGIVLRLKGVTCLHASAVEVCGKAVAFTGVMGAGKSTTAGIFARNGHPVLTDDIVALKKDEPYFVVHPGFPFLNLLPDAMARLVGSAEASSLDLFSDKSRLALDGNALRFQREALPLGAIYVLADRDPALSSAKVEPLSVQQAFVELTANTYANKMLDASMRSGEFRTLADLVKRLPVRRITTPECFDDIGNFYNTVRADAIDAMKFCSRCK